MPALLKPPSDDEPIVLPAAIIEVCLCHHLRRTARVASRAYDRALRPLGIKASQFNVLVAIAAAAPETPRRLASRLAMERTTVIRNLKPLMALGFVRLDPSEADGVERLTLTPAGENLLARAGTAWRAAQSALIQRLGATRAGTLLQALAAIAD